MTSRPVAAPQARNLQKAFDVMKRIHILFIFLPPRLDHARMYANHKLYNDLMAFLEERQLGWPSDTFKLDGKRFVEGMSKAFFQCSPSTWKSLNDNHNRGAIFPRCVRARLGLGLGMGMYVLVPFVYVTAVLVV